MTERLQPERVVEPAVLQALLDNTGTHLAYLDLQLRFVAVNATYARGSGHSAEQLIGRNHFDLFPNADNQVIFERVRATGEPAKYQAKPFEFVDRPELGITYWDWSLTPARDEKGQMVGLVLSLLDVTEQTRAQLALQESEARYRQLFMSMREGFALQEIILDERGQAVDYRFLNANPAFGDLTGLDPALIIGKTAREVMPAIEDAWIAVCAEVAQTGRPVRIENYRGVMAPWFEGTIYCPAPGQFALVFSDVTERLRGALDNMLDAYVLLSPVRDAGAGIVDFRVEYANPAACRAVQLERYQLIGRTMRKDFPRLAEKGMVDEFRRILEQHGQLVLEDFAYEDELMGLPRVRYFDVRANAMADGVAVAWRDATDRKRATDALRESREQLQAYSRRLVEAVENERRTIARELHDEAGQGLTALKVGLALLEHDSTFSPELAARVTELRKIADNVMAGLHDLSAQLRPGALDKLGLVSALEQHVQRYREQTGLAVEVVSVSLEGQRLPPEVETNLYRIAQECLTNVVRHAQATHVDILLQQQGGCCLLIVEDNGVGFEVNEAAGRGRLGLVGVRERAESLGGTFTIESAPGAGTTVYVSVPLDGTGEPCERPR